MYQPYGPGPVNMHGGMRPVFYRAGINLNEEDIPQDAHERIMEMDEFRCPICMEHPVNPIIILPCGHTLCDGCADDHAGHGGLDGRNATCPECRGLMDHMTDYNNFCYMFCPERLDPGELEQINAAIAEEGEHVHGPHQHPPRFERDAGHGQRPPPFPGAHDYGSSRFHPIADMIPPMYNMHHPGPWEEPDVPMPIPMPLGPVAVGFPVPHYEVSPVVMYGPHVFSVPQAHGGNGGHHGMRRRRAPYSHYSGGGGFTVPVEGGEILPRCYPNSVYTGELPVPDIGDYSIRPGRFVRRRRRD